MHSVLGIIFPLYNFYTYIAKHHLPLFWEGYSMHAMQTPTPTSTRI